MAIAGCTLYLPLENDANDQSGNSLNFTNINSVTFDGTAATFVRTSAQSLSRADNALLRAGGDWTMCGFFNFASFTGDPCIAAKWVFEYIIQHYLSKIYNSCPSQVSTSGDVSLNTWYFFATGRNATSNVAFMVVDAAKTTAGGTTDPSTLTNPMYIGQDGANGEYMDGKLKHISFFQRVLSDAEIAAIRAAGGNPLTASVAGPYRRDPGALLLLGVG